MAASAPPFVRPYDAVLFDLDGTLLDTAPEIAAAVNAALAELGLPAAEEPLVRRFIGHGVRQTIAQAYDHVSPGAEAAQREADLDQGMLAFGEHYGRMAPLSQPFADTVSTLTQLRAAGVKCAIVSNKEGRFVAQLLDGGPLPALIDLTICGDTLARKKPDPLPIAHTLQAFGVRPERALFVGDSRIDVACARNAGVQVWMVPYGYNGGQPASEAGADRVIGSLSEVARACLAPAPSTPH
ncbi:MAG: phosphoglycolate phosphatase [Nevskia sp.]